MMLRFWWARMLAVAAAYVVAGQAAEALAIPPGYASAVWPAAGIAFFAVSRWGWSAVLGVALGSFVVNLFHGSALVAALIAVGAGAQAIVAARLVRKAIWPVVLLDNGRDAALYLILAGPVACVLGATWATGVLCLAGVVETDALAFSWFTWWIGDTIGVVLTAPILLALFGEPRTLWRSRLASVALPQVLASIGVVVAFVAASRAQDREHRTELAARAAVVAHAIEQRIARYTEVASAAASFVSSDPSLSRAQFSTFASGAIGRDTGIQALGWCPRVTAETRGAFEVSRRDLDPGFEIRVMTSDGLAVAPVREVMFPVQFMEPDAQYEGVDLSSEPGRAEAVAVAEASGRPAATKPLRLLRGQQGLLLLAPVYSTDTPTQLIGMSVAGFAIQALVESATAGLDTKDLWITITDITSSVPEPFGGALLEATAWSRELSVGGRVWRIGVARLGPAERGWQAWAVLAAGLAFVSVLGGVLLVLTGGRARIEATEARYRDLYENAPDMYFTVTIDTSEVLECNAAAGGALGYTRGELVGRPLVDLAENGSRELLERGLAMLREHGSTAIAHVVLRRKDGVWLDVSVAATAIYGETEILAARVLVRDVSEIVEAERDHRFQVELGDALHTSESIHAVMARAAARVSDYLGLDRCHFGEIDAATQVAHVQQYTRGKRDSDDVVTFASFEQVGLGELLRGSRYVVEDAATDPRLARVYETTYAPHDVRAFIAIPLMRGGTCTAYFAVVSGTPRAWTPREVSLVQSVAERSWLWSEHLRSIHSLRDLSRYLEDRVEERTRDLVALIDEKDVLLKEIHHRVKNNLQVISSMLNLQARQLRDPVLASAFEESQQRIQTIALVHERLYQSRDLANIGLDEYLQSLVANVMYAQNASERGISVTTEIAGISLPIQRAIPCGLIVNELITNAVKHAFPAGRGGSIRVSMKPVGDQIELVVADDGVGLPADRDPKKADSLGFDLVYAFAEQLDARLDITSEHGAAFTLRFPAS